MRINPIGNAQFVADIEDVDLQAISSGDFEKIYQAWLQFGVIRIRNQSFRRKRHCSSAPFRSVGGNTLRAHVGNKTERKFQHLRDGYLNIRINGKAIGGLGNAEASWHSDMTYVDTPPPASVLLGIEIPPVGGDTYFADQAAAYAALPESLRQRISELSIKHDAAHTSIGSLRPGYEPFDDPRDAPGSIHPIIRTHEETGKQALYLGRREWAYIPGLSLSDSEALLDELWSYAALTSNVWQQTWQPNDLIVWDNRRVLHRRDDFDNNTRRLMKRCQVLARATDG
ncbi:MAG: TauD/TfdA family dioxygenase [Pseudomonadota bacterium]|nr:MAG: TauD/TfdA family dioxygenase [Pseudomonadota bacterium]